eukprot:12419462-Karenia_brevis.AAC.1
MHQILLSKNTEESANPLGIDETGIPMVALLQKQAALRETDKKSLERTTSIALENKRSIKQLDERETNRILVVSGVSDGWKEWQRDQVLWKMIGLLAEK